MGANTEDRRQAADRRPQEVSKAEGVVLCADRGPAKSNDGRLRFSHSAREEVYRYFVECIRRHRPDLEIGLCLEDESMFASLDLQESIGRCNCVL